MFLWYVCRFYILSSQYLENICMIVLNFICRQRAITRYLPLVFTHPVEG